MSDGDVRAPSLEEVVAFMETGIRFIRTPLRTPLRTLQQVVRHNEVRIMKMGVSLVTRQLNGLDWCLGVGYGHDRMQWD